MYANQKWHFVMVLAAYISAYLLLNGLQHVSGLFRITRRLVWDNERVEV